MKGDDLLEVVKGTPKVLEQVYEDLAQPSVRAVGAALGAVIMEVKDGFYEPIGPEDLLTL